MAEDIHRHQTADGVAPAGHPWPEMDRHFRNSFVSEADENAEQHAKDSAHRPDPAIDFVGRFIAQVREYLLRDPYRHTVHKLRIRLDMETTHEQVRIERERTFP